MPKIKFLPQNVVLDAEKDSKILVVARRGKIPIRFGCASCRCGTCAVAVKGQENLSSMEADERALLERLRLTTEGSVRLSCRAKILQGEVEVDLDFQETYQPFTDFEEESD